MFETQKSGNKTSTGEISLNIRTHVSSKVGQDQVFGAISVFCWHAAPVANVLWKPLSTRHIAITNLPFRFAFSHPHVDNFCDKSIKTTLHDIFVQVFLRFFDSSKPSQSVSLIYELAWLAGIRISEKKLLKTSCKVAPMTKVAHLF